MPIIYPQNGWVDPNTWLAGQPAGRIKKKKTAVQPTMYVDPPIHFGGILWVLVYYWMYFLYYGCCFPYNWSHKSRNVFFGEKRARARHARVVVRVGKKVKCLVQLIGQIEATWLLTPPAYHIHRFVQCFGKMIFP